MTPFFHGTAPKGTCDGNCPSPRTAPGSPHACSARWGLSHTFNGAVHTNNKGCGRYSHRSECGQLLCARTFRAWLVQVLVVRSSTDTAYPCRKAGALCSAVLASVPVFACARTWACACMHANMHSTSQSVVPCWRGCWPGSSSTCERGVAWVRSIVAAVGELDHSG
jgi:hypothetical protein